MDLQIFDGRENARDEEYLAWMRMIPEGFVGNFTRGRSSGYFCLHKARCHHIAKYSRSNRKDSFTTGPYIKVCSNSVSDVTSWAKANRPGASGPTPCKTCNPLFQERTEGPGTFEPEKVHEALEKTLRSIAERRGQSDFRQSLLRLYGGRCAISGCGVPEVLEAAHIYPYKGEQTNHPQNGILLRSDLHTLFDLGLITIEDDYTISVHESLRESSYYTLKGKEIRIPHFQESRPSIEAIRWHRINTRNNISHFTDMISKRVNGSTGR